MRAGPGPTRSFPKTNRRNPLRGMHLRQALQPFNRALSSLPAYRPSTGRAGGRPTGQQTSGLQPVGPLNGLSPRKAYNRAGSRAPAQGSTLCSGAGRPSALSPLGSQPRALSQRCLLDGGASRQARRRAGCALLLEALWSPWGRRASAPWSSRRSRRRRRSPSSRGAPLQASSRRRAGLGLDRSWLEAPAPGRAGDLLPRRGAQPGSRHPARGRG